MMTEDATPTLREVPRAIALRKLSAVENWRGRVVYVVEHTNKLTGPWLAWNNAPQVFTDPFGEAMHFVALTTEPDFWASELLGATPTLRRVRVDHCVTVAL